MRWSLAFGNKWPYAPSRGGDGSCDADGRSDDARPESVPSRNRSFHDTQPRNAIRLRLYATLTNGDPALDGKVANAIELIQKLAESKRAEQVFVRHAFRFWMGRNETLNDAPVLQDAYRAYKESGGSMNALLTSLLTSDAFLYRTRSAPALANAN